MTSEEKELIAAMASAIIQLVQEVRILGSRSSWSANLSVIAKGQVLAETGGVMNDLTRLLVRLRACEEAIGWVAARPSEETMQESWAACERADWMLWLASKVGVKREFVVYAACQCARTVSHLAHPYSLVCIETTEAWCRGAATIDDVRTARLAADAAANAADAANAAYAADAAAYDAAADADADAYDADAAAYAAYTAAAYAAAAESLADQSVLVRKHIPWEMIEAALESK